MLGNVLDLAKHDNGLLDPSPSDIPLHSFLAQVVQRFEPEYKNKGLQLELRCRNPVTARADREHLVRIFNNLLSNAVKFTSSGGLIIEVRVEAGTAFISFLDTGEGVPQAERDLIFNRFDQGTQGRRKGGVGLGLFLSQALAERNGGQLYFIEPPFGGSQFVLELPYVSQANHHTKGVSPTSVLIVEDDLATARMLKRYVSSVCSEVRMAESTEEAQRLLSASRPDIIISDLHFQGRSATEFFEGIPKSIPLLVISGESRANVSARITRRGPLMIMEKPVEANEVLAALKELSHQTLDYQQVMNQ
jgi:CheY-like chemotaxis protein